MGGGALGTEESSRAVGEEPPHALEGQSKPVPPPAPPTPSQGRDGTGALLHEYRSVGGRRKENKEQIAPFYF